ncbi:hypothetical protein P12x_000366 [Tundrisphaera lichenicola]|uniref:hypothetical protein n=1 Tax=Tundrisphaera lichenicola TaxID=2029860 RepID=UPI003EC0382D
MTNALDVVGDLMVEMGGTSARVEARGETIVVELPSFRAGYSLLKRWPGGLARGRAIRRIHEGLDAAGLRLEVRIGSRAVGRLGVGARAGLTSKLLGLAPMEIQVGGPTGPRRRTAD